MSVSEESTTAPDKPDGWLVALRRSLDRPLTSYYLVLGVTGLLLVLGLVMVTSASSVYSYERYGNSYAMFLRQLAWVGVAVPLAWLASRTPPRYMRKVAYPALLGAIVLLALTFVFRTNINGTYNWLSFGGPFLIQPSEPAKLALIVWGADVLARKEKLLDQWKHLVVPLLPVCSLVVLMVIAQGDLGTALIFMAIVLTLLFVIGMPLRFYWFVVIGVVAVIAQLALAKDYRQSRLTSFLDPFADYGDSGWQAAHGLFALGTGGWWGVNIGGSREKWGALPEAHTDFIFAVIGEELGLVGTLVVLSLFLTLAYVGIRIALRAKETFVRLAAGGVLAWILCQAMVNIGAVVGLLPITGVPLPLVSYGGSAMVPTLMALGLLLSLAKTEPGARAALAAREPDVFIRFIRRIRGRRAR